MTVIGPPRHPSQLYEAVLEGLVLFAILWCMFWKTQARYQPGKLVGAFILVYGLFRFLLEFVREPDAQLVGFAAGDRPPHGPVAVAADDPRRAWLMWTAKGRASVWSPCRHGERRLSASRKRRGWA